MSMSVPFTFALTKIYTKNKNNPSSLQIATQNDGSVRQKMITAYVMKLVDCSSGEILVVPAAAHASGMSPFAL